MSNAKLESDHRILVSALCKSGDKVIQELTPNSAHQLHMAVGIAGEAGELLDAIKKVAIYGKSPDIVNIIEELGDLEFYMEGLRDAFNITRTECLEMNIRKLNKRYKNLKYSNDDAIKREDKAND